MPANAMISSLTARTDNHTIHVRVGRVWEAVNKKTNTVLHTNLILLDEQDNHIMAMVRNNQKNIYIPLLKENGVYAISNFKVVPGPNFYRSVDRDVAINFFYKTKIQEKPETDIIPRYKFELQSFASVKNLVGNVKSLIDVMGMVTSYGQLEKRSNGAAKLDVVLANSGNETIVVALWEERATQFQAAIADKDGSAIFIVVTGLLAKKFSENASLSSTDATKTYINIDYAPLNELKSKLSVSNGEGAAALPPPMRKHFVTMYEENVQELSINSILESRIPEGKEVLRCQCKATITGVQNGNGWYYNCCPNCARAVRLVEGKYYCATCTEEPNPVAQRYRVVLLINDVTGSTTVTLFNKEAEQLIGVPLANLLTEMKQTQDSEQIPVALKNIIGKHCAFQIKINEYNITHGCEEYTVTRVVECSATADIAGDEVGDTTGDNLKKKQKCA